MYLEPWSHFLFVALRICFRQTHANKEARAAERRREELLAGDERDLTAEEEAALRDAVVATRSEKLTVAQQEVAARAKVELYEDAFKRIQEATGVKDENEVIQKILAQREQEKNLTELTTSSAAKIEQMQEELERLREHVERVRFAGTGARFGGKQAVEDLEAEMSEATSRMTKAKAKYERLARVLVDIKAGMEHLASKVEPLREATGVTAPLHAPSSRRGSSSSLGGAAWLSGGGVTIVDTVHTVEDVLRRVIQEIMRWERRHGR
jgi:hypothetical protein